MHMSQPFYPDVLLSGIPKSPRLKTILNREQILTLDDLTSYTREEFAVIRNVGCAILQEAEDILTRHGESWRKPKENPIMSKVIVNKSALDLLAYLLEGLRARYPEDTFINTAVQVLHDIAQEPLPPAPESDPKFKYRAKGYNVVIKGVQGNKNRAAKRLKECTDLTYKEAQKAIFEAPLAVNGVIVYHAQDLNDASTVSSILREAGFDSGTEGVY